MELVRRHVVQENNKEVDHVMHRPQRMEERIAPHLVHRWKEERVIQITVLQVVVYIVNY